MANVQDLVRKKSPRAPTISLDDAVERVLRIYDKERVHPAPADLVAQAMGYKDANKGRALGALASLRYYGLVDRVGEGKLAVSKDVEAFKYAPNNELRDAYLRKFLAAPPLFAPPIPAPPIPRPPTPVPPEPAPAQSDRTNCGRGAAAQWTKA